MAAGNEGELTVALDTALTEELLLEGLARELVNKVNSMRRELGFEVADRIHLVDSNNASGQRMFPIIRRIYPRGSLRPRYQIRTLRGYSLGSQWRRNCHRHTKDIKDWL